MIEIVPRHVTRDAIIAEVIRRHMVDRSEFFGRGRTDALVDARADAAKQLFDIGMAARSIARALKRDRTTIRYYLDEGMRARKKAHLRLSRFKWMDPVVREMVLDLADARGLAAAKMVSQWIAERALSETRSRVAA